jgi:hypothetical protein
MKKNKKQLLVGRFDILLQYHEMNKHYDVKVQLGKTDKSYIVIKKGYK